MKASHKLLFVLCTILVLLFIYYSSWKLQLIFWGHKTHVAVEPAVTKVKAKVTKEPATVKATSRGHVVRPVYDQQGFLIKLDGKLPPKLVEQYDQLSEGSCKRGYAAAMMTANYPKFVKFAPMFLDWNFKKLNESVYHLRKYSPPFGLKKEEITIDDILIATKKYDLGPNITSSTCKRCIIVGNGGILTNKSLGSQIDKYDVVVRLNEAPVKGYTRDVGNKTTLRITYPEGAFQKPEKYEDDSLFVLSAFKHLDFEWLLRMIKKQKLQGTKGFWKSVAYKVPREPSDFRILNPYFIQEAAFKFIGFPEYQGKMGKGNTPTIGTVAIVMALHNCDEVDVAGFGYNMTNPNEHLHYFDSVKMSAMKESWTHNIPVEQLFLRKLVKAKVIKDLTNGI